MFFPIKVRGPDNNDVRVLKLEEFREREEQRQIENALLIPEWENLITTCVRSMFRNTQRVRQLLRKWNEHPPFSHDVIASFVQTILTSPINLQMTNTHVYFFTDRALGIPRAWLTRDEHIFINKLVVARNQLFHSISGQGASSTYTLGAFKLNTLIAAVVCPRFIVQQFALDLVECGFRIGDMTLISALVTGVSLCWVRNKRDPFIARLLIATETRSILDDIRVMGMFVKIADAAPEYEFHVPRTTKKPAGGLPRIPTTPFRLVTPK